MAGHSKWANIKHRKAAVDKKRGKEFSKIARAIIAAARAGGGNPEDNLSLRLPLERARAANMPRDTVERAIKRGTGALAGDEFAPATYEAYGPGGAGILIQALTDNANRTVPEIRSALEKRGGVLGKPGSVSWNFEQKALFTVDAAETTEEALLDLALEAGAEDVVRDGDTYSVTGPPDAYGALVGAFAQRGIETKTSDVTFLPKSQVLLDPDAARKMVLLIESLEDLEDVQSAITNADIPDEVLREMQA